MVQVTDLQRNLVEEQKIVAEKKEKTGALIEAIGKEKVQVRCLSMPCNDLVSVRLSDKHCYGSAWHVHGIPLCKGVAVTSL